MADALASGTYQEIQAALPGISLVQISHVMGEESVYEAIQILAFVDDSLLDSGNPKLAVKELGVTGRVDNWEISWESIVMPIFQAGGLNPNNVGKAIDAVQLFGLDLCSSVRTEVNRI